MSRLFATLFAVIVISSSTASALAQSMTGAPPYDDFKATKFPDDNYGSNSSRVRSEDRVLKNGPLAPSASDRDAFKSFLEKSDTGLIRLMAREVYDSKSYRVKQKVNIPGGGAYYSFAHLTHAYGYGSDIELDRDVLSVGFDGIDYGMLGIIGKTPLDQITTDDSRVQLLAAYRPPKSRVGAGEDRWRLSSGQGMTFGGLLFQKSVPVWEDTTYLLRSIAFNSSDVLVAFRVVRRETDGSVIIAWKLLKRYSTPKLK